MSNFETWWESEGQEFLFALNTTTDDDIKLVAEVAWKNGAYCAEQAEQEPVAWMRLNEKSECEAIEYIGNVDEHLYLPPSCQWLYTSPVLTMQQVEPKPVAKVGHLHQSIVEACGLPMSTPLYAAPQPVNQEQDKPQKERKDFMDGYDAGMADAKRMQKAEQEPVANVALKDCVYFGSIDFSQAPPYLRYDTGDSTAKENWNVYCDIQEDLRQYGYELTDSDVDHDTVCGDVTPIATPQTLKEVELTDDEIAKLRHKIDWTAEWSYVNFARAVIAADRSKNGII